mmetsp:Transcript_145105/g.377551  ORF Transcript_145105/g.377551 Transcript_145105/m.377551 type:complete len:330 (-) Transcript_145105:561-1550(-)
MPGMTCGMGPTGGIPGVMSGCPTSTCEHGATGKVWKGGGGCCWRCGEIARSGDVARGGDNARNGDAARGMPFRTTGAATTSSAASPHCIKRPLDTISWRLIFRSAETRLPGFITGDACMLPPTLLRSGLAARSLRSGLAARSLRSGLAPRVVQLLMMRAGRTVVPAGAADEVLVDAPRTTATGDAWRTAAGRETACCGSRESSGVRTTAGLDLTATGSAMGMAVSCGMSPAWAPVFLGPGVVVLPASLMAMFAAAWPSPPLCSFPAGGSANGCAPAGKPFPWANLAFSRMPLIISLSPAVSSLSWPAPCRSMMSRNWFSAYHAMPSSVS